MFPLSRNACFFNNPITVRAVIVFPEPDSPTIPSISPSYTENEIPFTTSCPASRSSKRMVRFSTFSIIFHLQIDLESLLLTIQLQEQVILKIVLEKLHTTDHLPNKSVILTTFFQVKHLVAVLRFPDN